MTFKEYINNPFGAKTAVMSFRKMYEDLYHDKWDKIMTRENGHIDYKLYTDKGHCYAYLKIPSEVIDKFYYDIVIEMEDHAGKLLSDSPVKFFSNDPSFHFTFAHAFLTNNMTIKELSNKMSRSAKKPARERNPQNQIGYVKSLYFAYIFMQEKGLFHRIRYTSEGTSMNWSTLLKMIEHTDKKVAARQEAQAELTKTQKKEKEAKKFEMRKEDIKNPEIHANNTGHIKHSSSIGKAKGVKRSKHI